MQRGCCRLTWSDAKAVYQPTGVRYDPRSSFRLHCIHAHCSCSRLIASWSARRRVVKAFKPHSARTSTVLTTNGRGGSRILQGRVSYPSERGTRGRAPKAPNGVRSGEGAVSPGNFCIYYIKMVSLYAFSVIFIDSFF